MRAGSGSAETTAACPVACSIVSKRSRTEPLAGFCATEASARAISSKAVRSLGDSASMEAAASSSRGSGRSVTILAPPAITGRDSVSAGAATTIRSGGSIAGAASDGGGSAEFGRAAQPIDMQHAIALIAAETATVVENRQSAERHRDPRRAAFERPVELHPAPGAARGESLGDTLVGGEPQPARQL